MKLKSFDKVNTAVRTKYSVQDRDGNPIDFFTVDYLAPYGKDNVVKKLDLIDRGADIVFVSASATDANCLFLTVAV